MPWSEIEMGIEEVGGLVQVALSVARRHDMSFSGSGWSVCRSALCDTGLVRRYITATGDQVEKAQASGHLGRPGSRLIDSAPALCSCGVSGEPLHHQPNKEPQKSSLCLR